MKIKCISTFKDSSDTIRYQEGRLYTLLVNDSTLIALDEEGFEFYIDNQGFISGFEFWGQIFEEVK